jgi:tetratricopeptide (TPR) repeat protein
VGRIFCLLALAAILSRADEKWVRIRTGPFEILSSAGENAARDRAYEAEQLRYAFGAFTGIKEPVAMWPVRMVVRKGATPGSLVPGRDAYMSQAAPGAPLSREWKASCIRVLLDSNVNRMPAGIESGLMTLLSTLQVKGPLLTIGEPPPAPERTRDWARLEMLATDPELAVHMRVFTYNLAQGADLDAAYRNAFEQKAAEMERKVDAYLAAGSFKPAPFSGRALSARDFTVREVDPPGGQVATADLEGNEAAYQGLSNPLKEEGLGWAAERAGHSDEARKHYEAATVAGSKNARAWAALGTRDGLTKAAELNPLWPEPWRLMAELDKEPAKKIADLRKAATLARRDASLWAALATALQTNNQYSEAAKAWTAAESAATNDQDRERLRQERRDIEAKRVDFEESERRRIAEEQARELQRLKDQAMSEIHAAESKANTEMQKGGAVPAKVEEWWDDSTGPKEKATGKLERVECLRSGMRWIILTDAGKRLTLRVDAGKIVVEGGGEKTFGCGTQKPARHVSVEYAKGEIRTVEFQ